MPFDCILKPIPKNNCPIEVMVLGIGLRPFLFVLGNLISEMALTQNFI
jgi:hypothetical protein